MTTNSANTRYPAELNLVNALVASAPVGIILVDEDGCIIQVNPRAAAIFGYDRNELLGASVETLMPERYRARHAVLREAFTKSPGDRQMGAGRDLFASRKDGTEFPVEIGLSIMRVDGRRFFTTVVSDISRRKALEAEREHLIAELRTALEQVKALSGMLPICASCKKIRDDKGYWTQIESYIRDHSEAEFSHGICPECARRLYPELYPDDTVS